MVTYRGGWLITVTGKDSAWAQHVVVSGAASGGGISPAPREPAG
jgi:hypothetical protein